MNPLCAWCQTELHPQAAAMAPAPGDHHGICEACLDDLKHRQDSALLALVENLPHAALAVDGDLRIQAANQLACDLLNGEWVALVGSRLGEILGCAHEEAPEEDREDRHCSGCAAHRLVRHTLRTGQPGTAVLSMPNPKDSQAHPEALHRFTSLRLGDMATLRVDPLTPAGEDKRTVAHLLS